MQTKASVAPDPRLTKAIQALDQERRARVRAEQQARALRMTVRRLLAQRTTDAKPKAEEKHATG
jgi:hypothetical protein